MEIPVSIMVSARHLHLTEDTYYKLFDKDLTVKNPLNQVGQFAANETVTIKTDKAIFENVRIIGPFRKYNQVEISKTDARKLGLNPPVRKSGDVKGSEIITISTPKASVKVEACIIADRHVHFDPETAKKYDVVDGQKLNLRIGGVKPGSIIVNAKVSDDGYFEVHIDTDDANAFLIDSDNNQGTLEI